MNKEGYPALLLLSSVIGLALASALYLGVPSLESYPYGSVFDLYDNVTGALLPLSAACFLGFSSLGLPLLLVLTLLRSFGLTFTCYLFAETAESAVLCALLLICATKLLIFVSFCRLCLLFAHRHQQKNPNKRQYCLQFFCDYLFFCGISVLLCILTCLLGH